MSTALLDLQAEVQRQLDEAKVTVQAPTAKRITAKNGRISLPDGSTAPTANVIILSWRWMNRYYPNAFNPNAYEQAACMAVGPRPDTMVPLGKIKTPQGEDCSTCPKNQFGSAPGGGRGKACRNQAVLACLPGDGHGDMFTVTLAPTSIQAFSKYVMKLTSAKLIPSMVVTELGLDSSVAYAKFTFGSNDMVGETELLEIMGSRQGEAVKYLDELAQNPDEVSSIDAPIIHVPKFNGYQTNGVTAH